jgi:hypothetical protein
MEAFQRNQGASAVASAPETVTNYGTSHGIQPPQQLAAAYPHNAATINSPTAAPLTHPGVGVPPMYSNVEQQVLLSLLAGMQGVPQAPVNPMEFAQNQANLSTLLQQSQALIQNIQRHCQYMANVAQQQPPLPPVMQLPLNPAAMVGSPYAAQPLLQSIFPGQALNPSMLQQLAAQQPKTVPQDLLASYPGLLYALAPTQHMSSAPISVAQQGNGPTANVAAAAVAQPPKPRKKRAYNHESFPSKLHRLLREAKVNGKEDIARFTEDGTQFQILATRPFEEEILPNYFRHGSISSFKRLLRMYGFRRTQGTWMEGTFEHPLFQLDAPELCKQMERVGTKYGSEY